MKITAYKPLAKFGTVYYVPTPKGFIFYDKRTKTALLSGAFTAKIHTEYINKIQQTTEWYLPKQEITIKRWACNMIKTTRLYEKYEKEVFIRMGYHYVSLGKPKNFWQGLLNLDPRFKLYVLPKITINPKGSIFAERIPYSSDNIFEKLERIRGTYLSEKLILSPNK